MSVSNQTNKTYGSGNGVTTTFSYPFKIFDTSELYAYLIDSLGNVTGPLTYTTDFTATISAVTEGGTITFVVAPPTGYTWFLKRLVPYTQTASIPSEGIFPGKQFENQLDLITMMVVQGNEAISRALTFPTTYLGSISTLPNPQTGLVLGWDSNGNVVNISATGVGTLIVPIADSNLQQIATAAKVKGSALTVLSGIPASAGILPLANLPFVTGTTVGTVPVLDSNGKIAYANLNAFPYVKVSETQTSGTAGGTSVTGSWIIRKLNTKDSDTAAIASIASNQVTLPAGTYIIRASSPFFLSGATQIRLQNITASTTLLTGMSGYSGTSGDPGSYVALLAGAFTLGVSSVLQIQYQVSAAQSSDGLGVATSFGTEVYTVVEFEKIS